MCEGRNGVGIKLVLKNNKTKREKPKRIWRAESRGTLPFAALTRSFGVPPTAGRLLHPYNTSRAYIFIVIYIYIREGIYCLDQKLSSSLCDGSILVAA